jgi:4-aminobutyrate aminotransferase-like enzyme
MKRNESERIWKLDQSYVVVGRSHIAQSVPVVFGRGKGVNIYDVDGNEYLDFSAGILTASTGHCHPRVVKRVKDQAELLWHVYAYPTPDRHKFCKLLSERMPEGIDTFAFYCEGGIVVEAALRAAASYNKRYLFAAMTHGYHGRTLWTRSLAPSLLNKEFGPVVNAARLMFPYCYRCPLKLTHPACGLACIEAADDLLQGSGNEPLCALIVEPIAGAGGVIVPPQGAWRRLAEICRARDMLIIDDEVLTGVGRTGKFLAMEHFGVKPDLVTFGKGLGSGFPIMVVAGKKKILSAPPFGGSDGDSSTSFGGNSLAVAAGLGTLEVIRDEKLVENARLMGEELKNRLSDWPEKYRIVGDVRGMGLLWGIELVKDKTTKEPHKEAWDSIYQICLDNGVRLVPNRICPPLVINKRQLHRGLDVMEDAIRKVDNAGRKGAATRRGARRSKPPAAGA